MVPDTNLLSGPCPLTHLLRAPTTSLTHSTRKPRRSAIPQAAWSVQSPMLTSLVYANSISVPTNATYQIQKEELHAYERHLCSCERYSPIECRQNSVRMDAGSRTEQEQKSACENAAVSMCDHTEGRTSEESKHVHRHRAF
ncbi:Hypothetical predicted protein [Pelobates cultripes]|uniref:Uncharacterized protein n=1 Tax=Pelobates cultripes TaxID=61616 RepID=A0AAD1SV37_PELCU|nr:Hypothetical predicted protein [Pelobates cultripes]